MKHNHYFIILFVISLQATLFGQSFKEKFYEQKDTINKLKILKNWEEKDTIDSDLYIAYYNYYMDKSRETGKKNTKYYGKPGKIDSIVNNNTIISNKKFLDKAIEYVDKAIKINPNRIDYREGKIYHYASLEEWDNLANEMIKLINYSNHIKNNWISNENKSLENPEKKMLNLISRYQYNLYYFSQNETRNLFKVSKAVYKYYPYYNENIFFLSECYRMKNNYRKSIDFLFEAYKLEPTNFLVIRYIAENYEKAGDSKKALEYFKLAIKYSDQQSIKNLQEAIDRLGGE